MIGGVVFGPPGWSPARIESTFDGASEPFEDPPAAQAGAQEGLSFGNQHSRIENPHILPAPFHHLPHNRRDLALLLDSLGIGRTSAIIPALADQLRHLGSGTGDVRPRALVLNLLPTQPEFTLGGALTRLALADLRTGMHALHHILHPRSLLVVFDRHDLSTWRAWKRIARQHHFPVELRPLLNRYPQAHPTPLLRTLWGKRLQVDALPSRFNRLVIDPVTAWAFGRYLRTKQPLTDRPVQVFMQGDPAGGGGARLLTGRVGETLAAFATRYQLELAGRQIILNGMLAGAAGTADFVITGGTESISLRPVVPPETPSPCISCGWCVDVCPTALTPVRLMELNGRVPSGIEMAHGTGGPAGGAVGATLLRTSQARESLHCIGCGLCSYVCPTRLPLTEETLALRLRVLTATASRPAAAAGIDSPRGPA
jgi:Na+-translocating ferredoxin:NAD+ oxidoreductase RnfC subunit